MMNTRIDGTSRRWRHALLLFAWFAMFARTGPGAPAKSATAGAAGGAASVGIDLVRNGDFETGTASNGPTAWARCSRIPQGAVPAWTEGDAHSGKHALGIRSTYTADRPWFWWEQWVPLRGANTLEVRAFVRSRSLTRGAVFVLRFRGPSGGFRKSPHLQLPRNTDGKWRPVRSRFPVPPGATSALFQFSMHGSGEIAVDDLHIEGVFAARHGTFDSERIAPVVRPPRPLHIDGDLGDWSGVPELYVGRARKVSNAEAVVVQAEQSRGPKDLSFAFRLAFDSRALYLGVDVRDNVRRLARPYWRGDSIQFALDTRWLRRTKGYGPGDFAFGVTAPDKGRAPRCIVERRAGGSRLTAANVTVAGRSEPAGYTLEIAMPWRDLGIPPPRHNTVMGFTLLVNDSDGAGRKWAEWTPGISMGKSPARYGTLVFLADAAAPAVFPVPPVGPLTDARPCVVTAVVAALRKPEHPTEAVLRLIPAAPGGRALEIRKKADVTVGLTRIPFVLDPARLVPGPAELRVEYGPAAFSKRVQVQGLRTVIQEVHARVDRIREKVGRLQREIAAARKAGLGVALPDATCVTAEYFLQWVPADVSREGEEALALREAKRLEPLVDRALAEIAAVRANPATHPAVPALDIRTARLDHGNWRIDDRPVFLIGLNQLPLEVIPDLGRFGGNFVTVGGGAAAWTLSSGPEPDRAALSRSVVTRAVRAAEYPVRLNVLFGHRMPAWAIRKYPDITAVDGHFMDYDIDHPAARRLTCTAIEAVAKALSKVPGMTCYDVWNEAGYWKVSKRGLARFQEAMRKRYRSIEALNREWGTDFADFAAVRPLRNPETYPAAYSDWIRWNDTRVAEFAREMRDAVRRGDPKALTTMKISNEAVVMGSRSLTFRKRSISAHGQGIDRWRLARIFDIQGCDTRPTLLSPDYAFAWRYPGMAYDLQRSMAPDKPIDDSEWHGVQTVYHENDDQPAEYLDAALWFSYLHGVDMNITWWWSRSAAGEPKPEWFRGSLLTQPQLLDAWARNNITVQRFAPEIVAFQEQRPRVRLLFSKPSAILDIQYLDTLFKTYETLSWFGVPVRFVTEEMLTTGFHDVKLLVVPAARHASAGVREAVAELEHRGTTVVLIGKDCLRLDSHGKPWPGAFTPGTVPLPKLPPSSRNRGTRARQDGETPRRVPGEWATLLAKLGLLPSIRCVGSDGLSSKPVAFRTVVFRGQRLAYLIGLGKEPTVVRIEQGGKPATWNSLLSGRTGSGERRIKPFEVDLVRVMPLR